MKKSNHGGARLKAGRKPVSDPKQTVTIYVEQSILEANNGIEESKIQMYQFLKKRGQKLLKVETK